MDIAPFLRLRCIAAIISASAFFTAAAQQPGIEFSHLTVENGLPGNTINGVIHDSRGFIWIASENGVCRYNGYTFTHFRSREHDTGSISSNIAYVVFEDLRQRLWIGSAKGLDRFDAGTERFDTHYLQDTPVRAIYEDHHGQLWVGTDLGLYRYDDRSDTFSRPFAHLFEEGIDYNTITTLAEDDAGNLWIGTVTSGVHIYDPSAKTFRHFAFVAGKTGSLSSSDVRKIIKDHSGRMWLATYGGGLNLYMPETETFASWRYNANNPGGISADQLPTVWEDEQGKLWIGTDGNGLDIFDVDKDTFYHVMHSPYHGRSLSNNVVRCISGDGRGGTWIGTHTGGVNFFNRYTQAFFHYKPPAYNGNSSVTCFAEDEKGNLWQGTDGGGLCYFNRATNSFVNLRHDHKNANSLSDNRVLSLLLDRKGYLWVGTYMGGLCRYDPRAQKFTRYAAKDKSSLSDNIVWTLLEDSQGQVWIGTNAGLNRYDARTGSFQRFDISNSGLSNNMVRALYEDRQGRLWIGTQEGLNVARHQQGNFTITRYDADGKIQLGDTWIRTISEDQAGNLLVGTFEGGLNILHGTSGRLTIFKEIHGLSNNTISAILQDEQHNVWISTGRGLSVLDSARANIRSYSVSDGLQNAQFNINACFKTKNGEFLFGGMNGFTLFTPLHIEAVERNLYAPPLALTAFKIFNKEIIPGATSVLHKHINETREIVLPYHQHGLTFEFAALNFIQPERNQYAFRLVGLESAWNYVGDKRVATYTNLAPGHYLFQVKASNNAGVWNEEGVAVAITITPPFWRTWWFITVVIVFVLLLLLLAYSMARRRIREKIRTSRLIAELEIKALITQMNPHFIFNCLTSIQELVTTNKLKEAMHYLGQFSRLMRTVLQSSERSFIVLEQEVTLLESYLQLESMRFDKQFTYAIDVDEGVDADEIVIPSFLTQPFVENALWHGLMHKKGERHLAVTFSLEGSMLVCRIDDNGVGREAAEKMKHRRNAYPSMGIKIIYDRIKLMKQQHNDIQLRIIDKVNGDQPQGTTVIIKMPCTYEK